MLVDEHFDYPVTSPKRPVKTDVCSTRTFVLPVYELLRSCRLDRAQ